MYIRIKGIEELQIVPHFDKSGRWGFIIDLILLTAMIILIDVFFLFDDLYSFILGIYINILVILIYYVLIYIPAFYLKDHGGYAINRFIKAYKKGKLWKYVESYITEEDGMRYNVFVFKKNFLHWPVEVLIPEATYEKLMNEVFPRVYKGFKLEKMLYKVNFNPEAVKGMNINIGDSGITITTENEVIVLTKEEYEYIIFLITLFKKILKNMTKRKIPYG